MQSDETVDRRALLRNVGLAAAGLAGAAVLTSEPAGAASGQPVVQGQTNDAGSTTTALKSSNRTLVVQSTGAADAIEAIANAPGRSAVYAHNDGAATTSRPFGVYAAAANGEGVHGIGRRGVYASGTEYGVYAESQSGGAIYAGAPRSAILAESYGEGGEVVKIVQRRPTGNGLVVQGRTSFRLSGVATIAGSTRQTRISVTVPLEFAVDAKTFVIATLQTAAPGFWIESAVVNPSVGTVTISLNKAIPAPVKVGWIALQAP